MCDAETFTLNAAEDYAICESWQKISKKGIIFNLKNTLFEVCFMFGGICTLHIYLPFSKGKKLF